MRAWRVVALAWVCVRLAIAAHNLELSEAEAAECAGWIAGTGGPIHDPGASIRARGGFTSQYGQDKGVWSRLFKNATGKRYVYADVAANHYKRLSNTYFFDRCLGWSGLCVEPNPVYHTQLRANRTCHVVPRCVSNRTDEIDFIGGNQEEGVFGSIDGASVYSSYRHATRQKMKLRCELLQTSLERASFDRIHLLSLDVEEHEEFVLRGINFFKTRIDYILCESHCDSILPAHGYAPIMKFTKTEKLWELQRISP